MSKRKPASVSTLRQNVSHVRKMIQRVKAMQLSLPIEGEKKPVIKRFGSRLIINGEVFKPGDLENMKGKKASWQVHAVEFLEKELAKNQAKLIQAGKKPKVTEALTDLEVKHIEEGHELMTEDEIQEFEDWLNSGSPSWKKNLYYHVYGAESINRGDVREFLIWAKKMDIDLSEVKEEVVH